MTDLNKAIKLAEKASEQLQKSHVKQYTRSDGTVVQEHDDSRHPNIIGKISYHKIIGKEGRGEQKGNGDPTHHATTSIGHNGKEYTPTGRTGNSMHDGREVHEFESEDGHRVWADKRGNVHADSKSEADQYHKRGRFTEHEDSRIKRITTLETAIKNMKKKAASAAMGHVHRGRMLTEIKGMEAQLAKEKQEHDDARPKDTI